MLKNGKFIDQKHIIKTILKFLNRSNHQNNAILVKTGEGNRVHQLDHMGDGNEGQHRWDMGS